MQQLVLVVVAALIGGLFALAGVFVGPLVKSRQDEVQWRRDRRLDAYAEQDMAFFQVMTVLTERDAGQRKAGVAAELARRAVATSESRIRLLAPKSVHGAARSLNHAVYKLATLARDSGARPDESQSAEIGLLHEAFCEAARRDLGVN